MQNSDFPYEVEIDGEIVNADFKAEGWFELLSVGDRKSLEYCARCSDPNPNRDDCLSSQLMSDNHIFVRLAQFK